MSVASFIQYIRYEKRFSPHTVKAYARDLREFGAFLAARYPVVDSPEQVRRQMVVQHALSLRGAAPQ